MPDQPSCPKCPKCGAETHGTGFECDSYFPWGDTNMPLRQSDKCRISRLQSRLDQAKGLLMGFGEGRDWLDEWLEDDLDVWNDKRRAWLMADDKGGG